MTGRAVGERAASLPPEFVHRPIVMGARGLVVAGHHRAAESGAEMLRAGGNAMDAAIAAAATLAVVLPHMNGLGGDCFALWFEQASGRVVAINGSGGAPRRATPRYYRDLGHCEIPRRGPLSISTPGVVHGWCTALERFGTLPLATVLAPAIAVAEEGVLVDRQLQACFAGATYAELVSAFPALARELGDPGVRRLGERLRRPALAATLRHLAEGGAPMFYAGEVGRALIADAGRAGAILDLDDLAAHRTRLDPPLSAPFRGATLHAAPPNSQGLALALLLGMLDKEDRASASTDPAAFLDRFLGLKKTAFAYRDRLIGDPEQTRLPPDLLSPESLEKLAASAGAEPAPVPAGGGDTSTLVTMDGHGNAVSWVQSLFEELGSGIVSESTGIVLHNRLWLEKLAPGHPNTLAPGRRPFHTLCPALLVRGGRCALAIATPGDHGQPQTLAQVIVNLEDRGMDIQRAIESPRLRHDRGAELMVESRFPAPCLERLARSGYALRDVGPWARPMGGVNAIHQDEDGIRMGGADPRRASYAIAE